MSGSPIVGVMRVIFEVRALGRIGRQWSRRWRPHSLVVQAAQAQLARPTRGLKPNLEIFMAGLCEWVLDSRKVPLTCEDVDCLGP
jgi:hypothetical protein